MPAQPNIIVIYTDDQGTLDAGCYGSPDIETPYMDALAERGIQFTQAYAHTVCCPSRAGLLTGRYPQRCGINNWCSNHTSDENGINMNLDELTLASILKAQGYATAIFGKWHLGARLDNSPLAFGFEQFFGHRSGFIDNYRHMFLHSDRGRPPFHDLWQGDQEIFREGHYFPDMMTREALTFLETHKQSPFFLYLPFNLPHYPYQPDDDFSEKYKDLSHPRGSYAAMVSTLDRRIGQILQKVNALGLRDNTLIFYMSDNGHSTEDYGNWDFNYGAHGGGGNTGIWRGAKGSFFEGGIRVPAIISMPGRIPAGEKRDQVMTNMDLVPTVIELCGLPTPDSKLDGHSLWRIIADPSAESSYEQLYFQWQDQWMLREGNWKLIYKGTDTTGQFDSRPLRTAAMDEIFLANLADPDPEWTNHASMQPEIVKELMIRYEAWRTELTHI